MSDAAWWLGHIELCLSTGESAYRRFLRAGETRPAGMTALDLAGLLFLRGDETAAGTWLSRAQRLLRNDPDCVEHAYLRYQLEVEPALAARDFAETIACARALRELGRKHADPNLVAITTMAEGRALVEQGRVTEGLALIEEAMTAALDDELRPEWAGYLYCTLIATCHDLADLRRMRTWTEALGHWCSTLPAAVMFTGVCRVHRAQLAQVRGEWQRAEAEAA